MSTEVVSTIPELNKEEEVPIVPEEALVENRPFFTSEIYKIEVQNLPKFFGIADARKLFNKKHDLNVHKFKYAGKKASYMFLNFKNEEDREKGIAVIDGLEYKGKKLRAFKSKPAKDPLVRIKQKQALEEMEVDVRPIKERILSAVCPLYNMPYDEQIELKRGIVEGIIKKYHQALMKDNPLIKRMVNDDKSLELPPLEEFIKSPVINGYRNKCEFTIGLHPEDRTKVQVGFRLSSYKAGSTAVVNAEDVPFVPEPMKKVTKYFEEHISNSGYATYDPIALSGHWKLLLLRINSQNELMIKVTFDPQSLPKEELTSIQNSLKTELMKYKESHSEFKIISLILHFKSRSSDASSTHLLFGDNVFYESLGNLRFKISPESFFQINTPAAKSLYSIAGDLAKLNPETTYLIDVCCGTGTIGLFLSDQCKKVFGVEIVPEAVKDANSNAELNKISNVDFRAGKAEYLLSNIFKDVRAENKDSDSTNVVAIVDPPRNGLHPNAVKALRASEVDTLVYISCDMSAAMQNFVNLGKPESNVYVGNPFVPKRIIAVDLFPHTSKHFEVVILFQRLKKCD